ncbi:MAG: DUF547 domain-containing protein, partial [Thermoanaerobaculia bacterium]|nr:DUF547 domain-containing protein [Thermoanaerobaculia bacterium]
MSSPSHRLILRSASLVVLLLLPIAAGCGPPQVELEETYAGLEGDAVFDHSAFDRLLATHVDTAGLVDYAALAEDSSALDRYVASLAEAPFDDMGRDERLALLINAYNAFTLRLILDYYPVDSIRSIPASERWEAERWELPTGTFSLNQIEHELIRPNFREPRIHFALVCAAIGCPILRQEAYTGAALEEQLEEQTRFTHSRERWVRYERGAEVIHLTRLYDWYGGDFEQVAGSVLAYVARYRDDLAADLAAGHEP